MIWGGGYDHFFPTPRSDGELARRLRVAHEPKVGFIFEDRTVHFQRLTISYGNLGIRVSKSEPSFQLDELAEAHGIDGSYADDALHIDAQARDGIFHFLVPTKHVAAIFG